MTICIAALAAALTADFSQEVGKIRPELHSSCFNLTLLSKFQTSKLDQAYYYGCSHVGAWGYKDEIGEKYKSYDGLRLFGDIVREYSAVCAAGGAGGVTVFAAKSADSATTA